MRKIYSTALLLLGMTHVTSTRSQTTYECLYDYQVKNAKGDSDTYSTILQIGGRMAKFMDYSSFQVDSVSQLKDAIGEVVDKYRKQEQHNEFFFDQTVYQNQPTGHQTVYSVISPNTYSYAEKSPSIQWTLIEESDTICGYACKKAFGSYGGKMWTVWYAQEIPVPFGPWKLNGLPGLVMLATTADSIHRFEAIGFRAGTTTISAPDYPNCITTTREKFIKAKNHFEANPIGAIPPEAISEMTIIKGDGGKNTILVNNVQLRLRPNGYTPLETE